MGRKGAWHRLSLSVWLSDCAELQGHAGGFMEEHWKEAGESNDS